MAETKKLFTQELREATKSIHDISDQLVNAKLGLTMSDDRVWAEGKNRRSYVTLKSFKQAVIPPSQCLRL